MNIDRRFAEYMISGPPKAYVSFQQVRHFKPSEVGDAPDGNRMNLTLMWKLDMMRDVAGNKLRIEPYHPNGGFADQGHTGNWHCYKENEASERVGYAIDFHIVNLTLEEMFRLASLFLFKGIGVYPHWNNRGLHVDERLTSSCQTATWLRNSSGKYVALPEKYKRVTV